ncbi:MAG: penicillin-binding protein activator [Nitratireductor sp.]|nr:penicillin-binding protein activator [Nitratireductor sp.]
MNGAMRGGAMAGLTAVTCNSWSLRGLKLAGLSALLALAACQSSGLGIEGNKLEAQNTAPVLAPNPAGEVFGQGQVRIALLIPKSAPGNGATVANEIRNGALLAMQDFGKSTIQIVIKDTAGQAASAQSAANEAVLEGATAILGPVFSSNVSAASAVTLPAGRTMFAYSTDTNVARRGVYLLSFIPQDDTARAITYSISQGKRSILAFLPNNAEGAIRENVLRQVAGSNGANVQVIKYDRSGPSIEAAVKQSATLVETVDSIYIPEGGEIPNVIIQTARRFGIKTVGKTIIGSGTWESVKISDPQLDGAIYPGRDTSNFESFATRYQTAYGSKPSVWAALGYDSVTLATDLTQRLGPVEGFKAQNVENSRGFAGINGIFRLRENGTAERGLAIYQVRNGAAQVISPAPTSFSRNAS